MKDVQKQFSIRSDTFNKSANWITNAALLKAHVNAAGDSGTGLELCCGTGQVGKALKDHGFKMTGIDITKEMVEETAHHFPAIQHDVQQPLPFEAKHFDLVVMRQALFFFETDQLLKEIKRLLKQNGRFVLSQTVPFDSKEDEAWLKKVHTTKQAQMKKFYTTTDLENLLKEAGFNIEKKSFLSVRESITLWMKHAPELSDQKKEEVINLIKNTPPNLQKYRQVEIKNNELFENWNWVIFTATIKN